MTVGDIRNAISETKRTRRFEAFCATGRLDMHFSTPEDPACRETKCSGVTYARSYYRCT